MKEALQPNSQLVVQRLKSKGDEPIPKTTRHAKREFGREPLGNLVLGIVKASAPSHPSMQSNPIEPRRKKWIKSTQPPRKLDGRQARVTWGPGDEAEAAERLRRGGVLFEPSLAGQQ